MMNFDLLSLSFSAGVAAFFNPCGFALLPAYVSYYLGRDDHSKASWLSRAWRGLSLGALVSAGFFTVFGVMGLIFAFIGRWVAQYVPWVAAVFGAILFVLGALMLFNKQSLFLAIARNKSFVPLTALANGFKRFGPKTSGPSEGISFYLYGIGYAIASVGCTLPIFMIVVAQAFTGGFLNGILNFLAYSTGMTVMMIALSLVIAYSKEFIYRYLDAIVRYVQKLSALVLICAGVYVVYYQLVYSGIVELDKNLIVPLFVLLPAILIGLFWLMSKPSVIVSVLKKGS